jgi:16S rRNA (guanine(527)-N(7))-methyltransferase RsmG
MASDLPDLSLSEFSEAVAAESPEVLPESALTALHQHYSELRRWNAGLGLIGPGTAHEVVRRHYGEALAALPWIADQPMVAVDIGSGGGFPGLVLAAARPRMEMTLVEAREKKWSFLMAAARRAALPCRCLNARVTSPLPQGLPDRFDLLTARAVKLEPEALRALASRLDGAGSILLWVGAHDSEIPPELSPGRSLKLPGSERRRILELRRTTEFGHP